MEWITCPSPAFDSSPIIHVDFVREGDLIPVLPLLRHLGELRIGSPRAPEPELRSVNLIAVLAGSVANAAIERVRDHRKRSSVPLLVISEDPQGEVELLALRAGADEYIRLPINPELFSERVRALLRRTPGVPESDSPQNIIVDPASRHLRVDETIVELSPTEYRLIAYLFERRDTWVSTSELYTEVVGGAPRYDSSAVRVHVSNIRRKLGMATWCLCTQRGRGVKLTTKKGISIAACSNQAGPLPAAADGLRSKRIGLCAKALDDEHAGWTAAT